MVFSAADAITAQVLPEIHNCMSLLYVNEVWDNHLVKIWLRIECVSSDPKYQERDRLSLVQFP